MYEAEIIEKEEVIRQCHMDVADFYDEYAKHFGITLSTVKVLGVMLKSENCTQKDIIRQVHLPKQTVSAIIKTLEKQEMLISSVNIKEDKRNKIITFTPNGYKWATNIINEMKKVIYNSLQALGDEKITTFISILEEFRNNVQEHKNNIIKRG
jgi:DNA-binding MarR family transcriptional regulator